MARNGSGSYTKAVSSFIPGQSITASNHNSLWDDLVSEVSNSVAADGQTTITGPIKFSNGSASAPSLTFASGTDTGMYRKAANAIGFAASATEVFSLTTATATFAVGVVGTTIDATTIKQGGYQLVPPGVVSPYAGSSAPDGWLLCYGQAVSRSTYAALFTAISTTHGVGDNSTTFNLPDLRGRTIGGKDDMGGSAASRLTSTYFGTSAAALGAVGGAESHTLTTTQLAAHTHTQTAQQPTFTYTAANRDNSGNTPSTTITAISATGLGSSLTTTDDASPGSTASAGSDGAHNNVQPTIILNYIIKI